MGKESTPRSGPLSDAEIEAEIDELCRKHGVVPLGPKKAAVKPKVVTSGGEVVADADVRVSPADKNARGGAPVVEVRRWNRATETVTINMEAYAAQRAEREAAKRMDRELDPYRLGIYGRDDEE